MEYQNTTTDEEAEKFLLRGIEGVTYRAMVISQYRLSKQEGLSITESIEKAMQKVLEVVTKVIEKYENVNVASSLSE